MQAWDLKTDKLLWRKKIYSSLKLPLVEDQVNFISSMTNGPSVGELTIVNERGGEFTLDTTSRKVTRVKGSPVKGW